MNKVFKWLGISLAVLVGVLVLAVGGLILWNNWADWFTKKTSEQKASLKQIERLGNKNPQPIPYSAEVPDAVPEIYTDQLEDEDEKITDENEIDPED